MRCDGCCDELLTEGCSGSARPVIVKSTSDSPDPFLNQNLKFNYCDTAIKKDRENGYRVVEL